MSTSVTTFVPESPADAHHDHHHKPNFFFTYIWSVDHKMIGLQYLWTSFVFLLIGGLLAMGIRYQLAYPGVEVPLIGSLLPSTIAVDG
ncbi:MAG: cytochrome C oxidase subunit I, partial [Chthoniobacterales bacterium]